MLEAARLSCWLSWGTDFLKQDVRHMLCRQVTYCTGY